MTKIYGIYGYTTANVNVPIGDGAAHLSLEFTKGNTQAGAYYRPATYVSVSKVEQDMIEGSPLFGKTIILYKSFGEQDEKDSQANRAAAKQSKADKPAADGAKTTSYPEVTTAEELRAVLKSLGAKATVLTDPEATKNFIARRGLEFPNYQE